MTDLPNGSGPPTAGTIAYGPRAAMQDSSLAMGRDVLRALVEMVTNAADSYARLERRGVEVDGVIEISAERLRSGDFNRIVVRDRAEGMRLDDVVARILRAGDRTSEAGDRGVMGRGAKDIAFFGRARYESIRDGYYTQVIVDGGLRYEELEERPATAADYRRLGLPDGGHGTAVTLFVRRQAFSVPRHDTLARRLARHVQLRAIMTSVTRTVTLADLVRPGEPPTLVRYTLPARALVRSVAIAIPGEPEAAGTLELYRHDEPLEDVRTMDRDGGIVIDDGSAIHEATYFGFEGRPGALRFSGWLRCPYIRTLQDRWDDAIVAGGAPTDPANPLGIISRTRGGLSRDHPFTLRLAAFAEDQLRPLVAEEEEAQAEQAGQVTEETRRRLRAAVRDLGARMAEVLRRLEVEYRPLGPEDAVGPTPVRLRVVPPTAYLAPETTQTFSIHAWPEAWADVPPETWTATITILDPEVATVSATEVPLEVDPRDDRRRRGAFGVTAGTIEDATLLEVRLGAESAIVELAVAALDTTPVVPTRLTFSQGSYRAHPGRPKTLVLMAPESSVAATASATVRLTSTQAEIAIPESVTLELRDGGDGRRWYEAEVACLLAGLVSGRVRAALGAEAAVCTVSPAEDRGRLGFDFKPVDEAPRYASQGRADWFHPKGVRTLHIFAQHPSLRPYFGERLARQESREARMLLAEIVASELAIWTLQEADAKAEGALSRDAHTFSSRLKEIGNDYLAVAHRCLVPEMTGNGS
jgi:hypothetical protein